MAERGRGDFDISKLDCDQVEVMRWSPADGDMRVVAAAGSGKTTTVTALVTKLLLVDEIPPERILIATFANKAAAELKIKLKAAVGDAYSLLSVGTFHSIGLDVLKRKDPVFWDTRNCVDLGKNARAPHVPHIASLFKTAVVYGTMPGTKAESLKICDFADEYKTAVDLLKSRCFHEPKPQERYLGPPRLREVWEMVEASKQALRAWEFADVLSQWLFLLQNNAAPKYDVVIVDEAQDNTLIQLELAQALKAEVNQKGDDTGKLVLVGDLRQTIYTWRGAYPSLFSQADVRFGAITKELRFNYRSLPQIVKAANLYTENKSWKLGSDTQAVRATPSSDQSCIFVDESETFQEQARRIAAHWQEEHPADGGPTSAFLVRTNGQLGLAEGSMIMNHVPYVIMNGQSIFQQSAASAFVNYIKAVSLQSPEALEAVADIGNIPKRYLSSNFLTLLRHTRMMVGERISQTVARVAKQQKLSRGSLANVMLLVDFMDDLYRASWSEKVTEVTKLLANNWNDVGEVHENDAIGVLMSLSGIAQMHDSAEDFLKFVDRAKRIVDSPSDGPHIVLSTIHRAKGLEWDTVYVDVTNGMIPHKKASSKDQGEEEQRLLYVAMTRAKNNLFLCYVQSDATRADVGGMSQLLKPLLPQIVCV